MTFDTIVYCMEWFIEKMFNIFDFIFSNRTVLAFVILPIVVGVLFVIIDFIFDFVNEFSNSKKYENYLGYSQYKIKYNRIQEDKKQSREDFYNKNKELAELKHKNKMEELNKFKENADYRHSLKVKENEMYQNSRSDKTFSSAFDIQKNETVKHRYKSRIDKSKLDIEVD